MNKSVFTLLVVGCIACQSSQNQGNYTPQNDYVNSENYEVAKTQQQQIQQDVGEYEKQHFAEFLILSDATLEPVYQKVKKGLFRKEDELVGWDLTGKIANKASKVDFTEVLIEIQYFNEQGTAVKSEQVPIGDIYEHGYEKEFRSRVSFEPYKNGSFSAEIKSASEASYH